MSISVPDTAVVQKGFAPRHRDRRHGFEMRSSAGDDKIAQRPGEAITAGRALRVFALSPVMMMDQNQRFPAQCPQPDIARGLRFQFRFF